MINKSYYAIIPANVRYDEDLTPNAKLLYGEITALCNDKGYCWANNSYFSELYKVKKETISRWISSLEKKGYISSELDQSSGNSRKIFLSTGPVKSQEVMTKKSIPSKQYNQEGHDKKINNNTTVNTTSNNTGKTKAETDVSAIEVFHPIDVKDEFYKTLVIAEKEKVAPKRKGFSTAIENCYENCLKFFPENLKPKTHKQQGAWMDEIRKLNELDQIPFEAIEYIVQRVRQDDFWSKNFLSLTKLRKKNREDIAYVVVFFENFKPKESKLSLAGKSHKTALEKDLEKLEQQYKNQ